MYKQYNKIGTCVLLFSFMSAALSAVTILPEDTISHTDIGRKLTGKSATYAISKTSGDVLYRTAVPNLSNALAGNLSGLTVMQTSGEPGWDAATLTLRGMSTFNNANMTIFLDGFETNYSAIQCLSPFEIADVILLKDAAALVMLGVKGGNGALWITTKRGIKAKPSIQLHARAGLQQPGKLNKPFGSADYARLYNEAYSNDNNRIWQPIYSQTDIEKYRDGSDPVFHPNVDWYDEVLRSNTPFYNADLSFTGGNDVVKYFLMLGYANAKGLYDVDKSQEVTSNLDFKRYNIRANLDFNISSVLEAKLNVGGKIEDRKSPNYVGNTLWNNMSKYPSLAYPVQLSGNRWTGNGIFPDNPVAAVRDLGYNSTHDMDIQFSFMVKEKLDFLLKGLYLTEAISFNAYSRGTYNKTKDYTRYEAFLNGSGEVDYRKTLTNTDTDYEIYDDNGTTQWNRDAFEVAVGYDNTFDKNIVSSIIKYHLNTYRNSISDNGANGVNAKYGFRNVSGNFNYMYDHRYIAEFGFSASGSDNYKHKWSFYPALSAAWVVTNEHFIPANKYLGQLKLRLSGGLTGNDKFDDGRYLYQQYYGYGNGYGVGNAVPNWIYGIYQYRLANENIGSEKSLKYNLGIDASFFMNRLDMTLDLYYEKREDILAQNNELMAVLGVDVPYENIGKVTNKGLELQLVYKDRVGRDFSYSVSGMFNYNHNKIDYMAEEYRSESYMWRTGRRIGTPFGLESAGFYDIDDFDLNGKLLTEKNGVKVPSPNFGSVQPGDIKYIDNNGDGVINENDETAIGRSYYPQWNMALNLGVCFKQFDLSCLFQGVLGREVNLLDAGYDVIAFVDNANAPRIAEERWAYYPDQEIDTRWTATYPRLTTTRNDNNYRNSTFWMKNGDYFRLQNIELGYTLPSRLTQRVNIQKVRFYVNASNLCTVSSLLRDYDIDPEVMTGYPVMRSYNIGVNLNF